MKIASTRVTKNNIKVKKNDFVVQVIALYPEPPAFFKMCSE